jgi:hypothetical protein
MVQSCINLTKLNGTYNNTEGVILLTSFAFVYAWLNSTSLVGLILILLLLLLLLLLSLLLGTGIRAVLLVLTAGGCEEEAVVVAAAACFFFSLSLLCSDTM